MNEISIRPFRRRAGFALLAAALTLGGCASLFDTGTPEEQVARRAKQRWDALIKRDFDSAYDYTQPGYRATAAREDYKKRFGPGQWKSAEIYKITCEPERCTVRIHLTTINPSPIFARYMPELSTYMDEIWVRDEGRWWYYQAS